MEALEASRSEHFAAVRTMLETLDVLVFTFGLTESWRSRADGAILPLAPGVAGGELTAGRYEFVNFSVADVVSDMQSFIARLRSVNPRARLLLTATEELHRKGGRYALCTMCIGVGQGIATLFEREN